MELGSDHSYFNCTPSIETLQSIDGPDRAIGFIFFVSKVYLFQYNKKKFLVNFVL